MGSKFTLDYFNLNSYVLKCNLKLYLNDIPLEGNIHIFVNTSILKS